MPESSEGAYGAGVDPHAVQSDPAPARLTVALAWIAAGRARDAAFDGSLFFTPAWDILLDLYVSHARGRSEYVTSVCAASSAPATTVSRWIVVLEKQGLIERSPDPTDKRRILLSYSQEGLRRMEQALDSSAQSDARLGLGRLRHVK